MDRQKERHIDNLTDPRSRKTIKIKELKIRHTDTWTDKQNDVKVR